MQLRGEEILIGTTMVGAYPRPHWLQGRVFGSLEEPLYRSMNQRVAYEDAVRLCCQDQEEAGLDLLTDGIQYEEWEASGYEREPLFHYHTENMSGFTRRGRPNPYPKYGGFYVAECVDKVQWVGSYYEGVAGATKLATSKPFKIGICGPVQTTNITKDRHYHDQKAFAFDVADAMNEEFKYLHEVYGIESFQVTDPSPHYIDVPWMAEAVNRVFDGLDDTLKVFHLCYGSVEGQPDIWEKKAPETIAFFADLNAQVFAYEMANRNFNELDAFRKFPEDRILCAGVIDDHNWIIETPEQVAEGIRKVLEIVPPERLMVAPDCGLCWFNRGVAKKKLTSMVEGARIVRDEL